ncbi:MAG: hypothetical protein JNL51_18390 [Chitinophagaceae bacterium]|nr:hypothetical protein [Chitinophagaceae bacterium]
MNYYITEENGELKIVKVHPADDANFQEDYGQYVLAKGSSMAEALLKFEEVKYPPKR